MKVHLRAARFGLRDGGRGAACETFVDGDALSDRHDLGVGCLECWRAYGMDRSVKLAVAQVEHDRTWDLFAEALGESGLKIAELEAQLAEAASATPQAATTTCA